MRSELISHTLPNLVNGISEQSPKVRLESQSQDEVNTLHDVSRGLRKRLPTHRDLKIEATDDSFVHYIDKSEEGLFAIILDNNQIKAYDVLNEREVLVKGDTSYLAIGDKLARKSFAMISISDVSWILNKTKVTAKGKGLSGTKDVWAAARFKQIACDVKFTLTLDVYKGNAKTTTTCNYTIPRTDPHNDKKPFNLSSLSLPHELSSRLTVPAGVTKTILGGDAILIQSTDKNNGITRIDLSMTDTMADTYSTTFGSTKTVNDYTDLPAQFKKDLVVKVKGADDTSDDYYVKWGDEGVWRETLKDDQLFQLEPTTLPYRLNLEWEKDGTPFFNFVAYTWKSRECGDTDSNLFPSFVGHRCTDIFFHKNRLGLISDENIVLTQDAKYSNFFVSTMRTALDSDMIDLASPTNEITELSYAIPFNKQMVLFSPKTQFVLSSGASLTPHSVAMLEASKYENDKNIRPIPVGSSLFYITKLGQTSAMWEMKIGDQQGNLISSDVSAHVPTLIKGAARCLSGTSLYNKLLVVAEHDNKTDLYVYSYHTQGGKRLQSAWSRWHFNYSAIVDAKFINDKMYVLLKRPDGYYIEHTHIDADPMGTELEFVPHLDSLREDTKGADYEIVYKDVASNKSFVGVPYTMEYQLSEQVLHQNDGVAISDVRLQLRTLTMSVDKTGDFEVQITPVGRDVKVLPIQARIIGGVSSILNNKVALLSDDRDVPIHSNAHTVKIKIVSSKPYPLCIQSAAFKGLAVFRSRSM